MKHYNVPERDFEIPTPCFEEDEYLLTNFDKSERSIYEKAITLSGETTLFIRENAYDVYGHKIEEYNALCCTEHKDYSAFWRCFKTVKATTR